MDGRTLIVVGHKNPDTDSICAAICYARLKSLTGTSAKPYRAGNLNAQTRYVLERFDTPAPTLLTDVHPRLSDIMIDESLLINLRPHDTVGRARSIMLANRFSFLPVTDAGGQCLGMVSLLGIAALPERLKKFRTGYEVTFYPEELIIRAGGRTSPERSAPEVFRGTVVAPLIDTRAEPAGGSDSPRLFIVPQHDLERLLESTQMHPEDMIIAYDASAPAHPEGGQVLYLPSTLMETIIGLCEASPLEDHLESAEPLFSVHDLVRRTEREINKYNAGGFIVVDDEGITRGVITRQSFLNKTQFQIALVDHNELSQAVDGAEHAEIVEVIDHHRLGARSTELPVTFINRVVGSTCTIIADMFRNETLVPDPQTAGLMLSAILSDTVVLKSPTTTPLDREIAVWLAGLAEVEIDAYGEEMFAAGSELGDTPAPAIIRQDQKRYEEAGFTFVVSQIETVGFKSFNERAGEIADALEASRLQLNCDFACLLVTDITRETSLLLFAGSDRVETAIQYPLLGDGQFEMHGILSRKKQLLPYLLDVLKNL